MPRKLTAVLVGSPRERLAAFRATIPNETGYTMDELAGQAAIGLNVGRCRDICSRNHWTVQQWDPASHRLVKMLVNPKALAKYARQAQPKT